MTVLAAVRLMPRPPARVERIKMKTVGSWLNLSIKVCLRKIREMLARAWKFKNTFFTSVSLFKRFLTAVPVSILPILHGRLSV